MERRPLKARAKVDSMGPAEGLMETTTQTKTDYMVRFFSASSIRFPYIIMKKPLSDENCLIKVWILEQVSLETFNSDHLNTSWPDLSSQLDSSLIKILEQIKFSF